MGNDTTFCSRDKCVLCNGNEFEVVWRGAFLDPPVRGWLEGYGYDTDLSRELAGSSFERVRCASCEMAFHREILNAEGLQKLYGSWITAEQVEAVEAAFYASDPDHEDRRQRETALMFRQLESSCGRGATLVDFGCGAGSFVRAAQAAGFAATGIDFSETRQGQSEKNGVAVVASFDEYERAGRPKPRIVTMFEVLEHLAEPREVLLDIASRMEPNGILIVTVPDCSGIEQPHNSAEFANVHPLEHINHFTPSTLAAMLDRAGFDRIRPGLAWAGAKGTLRQIVRREPSTVGWFRLR
jgi:2-polyprenyl-3-methyl-5-hydroxy-6-metoxy-1,4-benzoquinol methylase